MHITSAELEFPIIDVITSHESSPHHQQCPPRLKRYTDLTDQPLEHMYYYLPNYLILFIPFPSPADRETF